MPWTNYGEARLCSADPVHRSPGIWSYWLAVLGVSLGISWLWRFQDVQERRSEGREGERLTKGMGQLITVQPQNTEAYKGAVIPRFLKPFVSFVSLPNCCSLQAFLDLDTSQAPGVLYKLPWRPIDDTDDTH